MPLPDEDTGVVNGLGHSRLEDEGLQAALEEVLDREGENIIELVLALVKEPMAVHPAKKRLTLKDPTRVLLIEREKLPRGVPDAAQGILHAPKLSLAAEPVLAYELQLSVETLLLVRTPWLLESLPICNNARVLDHDLIAPKP